MQFVINPKSISESDVVVIGGGPAGMMAAITAAEIQILLILTKRVARITIAFCCSIIIYQASCLVFSYSLYFICICGSL